MTNVEIVMKLIGKVNPIGETETDEIRYENLVQLCKLIDELENVVIDVACKTHQGEYSIKRAVDFANKFLNDRTQ